MCQTLLPEDFLLRLPDESNASLVQHLSGVSIRLSNPVISTIRYSPGECIMHLHCFFTSPGEGKRFESNRMRA